MATGYTTPGTTVFINSSPTKTLQAVLLDGVGTKDHYSFETGVKFADVRPFISNADVDVSTGDFSGYTAGSGGITAPDIKLTNISLTIKEDYKPQAVAKYVLGLLSKGTDPANGIPAGDIITKMKGINLHAFNEKFIWQATTDTSTTLLAFRSVTAGTTLNGFDGVLKQLYGVAGGYGNKSVSFSGIGDTSTLFHVQKLVEKMQSTKPQLINIPTTLSMSPTNFSSYARAVYGLTGAVATTTLGLDGKGVNELYVPGTQIKAVSEVGLSGVNDIVLTYPENIIVAYDLENEDEKVEFFYSNDAAQWILRGWYKLGVKVVDPSSAFMSSYAG